MKKQALRTLVLTCALALCFSTAGIAADRGFTQEELSNIQAAASAPQTARVMAVTREFVGSMDNIGQYIDRFMQDFSDQGLDSALNGYRSEPVVVLLADPGDGPATMQVGLTVPSYVQTSGALKMQEYEFAGSVSYTYTGSYDQLCPAYYEIAAIAGQQGMEAGFPVVMMPIDDPRFVEPDKVRTSMIIPVNEKSSGPKVLETLTSIN